MPADATQNPIPANALFLKSSLRLERRLMAGLLG